MHQSAMQNCSLFFDTYIKNSDSITVLDIGAQDINGSLKELVPHQVKYIGVDVAEGKNVDIVLDDPYKLPFEDGSIDAIVSSSCFEHSEMFWLLFLEIMRILKKDGLFYLNAPSIFVFHRFPVDCYRFFPDSGNALVKWGQRNGYDCILLEHYNTPSKHAQIGELEDYVGIFLKDKTTLNQHPKRILHKLKTFRYGCMYPEFSQFLSADNLQKN
ncbi:MAG: class I SAM-dependent methyltransferase [Proteobacteria bacterium]|nr:class I SAM-dependent methyltransferase [Pseudomonadota bacterium]MBU1455756.1 class I SAM-dependent methyltransferase [Pseudomonadota bacterium]